VGCDAVSVNVWLQEQVADPDVCRRPQRDRLIQAAPCCPAFIQADDLIADLLRGVDARIVGLLHAHHKRVSAAVGQVHADIGLERHQ
jgi:hypothetical protein